MHVFNTYYSVYTLEEGMAPPPVPLPGESRGQRSLAGYSPRGRKDSDTTEQLSTACRVCVCVVTCIYGLSYILCVIYMASQLYVH